VSDNGSVRHHGSITSLSWIPSEAVEGSTRLAFDAGVAHYDAPPPEVIEDLEALRAGDRFRFANVLSALMGSTSVKLDPMMRVEEDGRRLAEYGPGALLGERAHLEGGKRTSTLVAVTPRRVAAVEAAQLDRGALQELSKDHRRTQPDRG
jgi:Cyclic nucleotide-binding domain